MKNAENQPHNLVFRDIDMKKTLTFWSRRWPQNISRVFSVFHLVSFKSSNIPKVARKSYFLVDKSNISQF